MSPLGLLGTYTLHNLEDDIVTTNFIHLTFSLNRERSKMQGVTQNLRRTCIAQARALATKASSTTAKTDIKSADKTTEPAVAEAEKISKSHQSTQTKTIAEKDAELMQKLAGISGDGGESGVEYEDGKASAMKRSVKNNMFRLI